MRNGYLLIRTHRDHPDLVQLAITDGPPREPDIDDDAPVRLRYAAHFTDVDAALMHTHEILRRHLVDINTRRYRRSAVEAAAAADAIDLRHFRLYFDPCLAADPELARITNALKRRRQRRDNLLSMVGVIALIMLMLSSVLI